MLIQLTFETIEETELASKIYSSSRKAHSNGRVSIDWCFLEGQIMREFLYIHAGYGKAIYESITVFKLLTNPAQLLSKCGDSMSATSVTISLYVQQQLLVPYSYSAQHRLLICSIIWYVRTGQNVRLVSCLQPAQNQIQPCTVVVCFSLLHRKKNNFLVHTCNSTDHQY